MIISHFFGTYILNSVKENVWMLNSQWFPCIRIWYVSIYFYQVILLFQLHTII